MKKVIRLTESDLTRIVKRVIIEQNDYNTPKKWKDWKKEGYKYDAGSIPPSKNDMFYGQLNAVDRIKQNCKDWLQQTIYMNAQKYGFDRNVTGLEVCKVLNNGNFECRLLTKEKLF